MGVYGDSDRVAAGYKKDVWYAVDPVRGIKMQTLSMDGNQKVCPSSPANTIFLGRTGQASLSVSSK